MANQTLRQEPLRQALQLAKEATNGWACYAKRNAEHAEIGRLHAAIDRLTASSKPDAQEGTAQELLDIATWIRTPGNIDADDARDDCARVLENRARTLTATPADTPPPLTAAETLNINDHVWVRLRERGKKMLRDHDERWSRQYGATFGFLPTAEKQEADYDGWSQWQLWRLIDLFGPEIRHGSHLPFETTIRLAPPKCRAHAERSRG